MTHPFMTVTEQLQRDEGLRLDPYPDVSARPNRDALLSLWEAFVQAGGTVAIGYGRNLSRRSISLGEARTLLEHDVQAVTAEVLAELPWSARLIEPRRGVLVNMAYNLGLKGLKTFSMMLAAAERGDWVTAAAEMRDSRWAGQVGSRSERLATQMEIGAWQ